MKIKLLLSTATIFSMTVITAFSQTWVEKMQDPTVNFYEVQQSFNDYFRNSEIEKRKAVAKERQASATKENTPASAIPVKGKKASPGAIEKDKLTGGWKAYKRWEDYMKPRLYPSGDRSVMINAWNEYLDSYYAGPTRAAGPSAPTTMAANWTLLGPTTSIPTGGGGAGRVNFVRFDPTVSSTIYVGSPGGGLWKSTNSGTTWTTGTDNLAVIGTTDLAIHPTNPLIQYLATGDGEAQDTYSIGVLKTTDGGTTWNPTGLTWVITNGRTISRLLINPQNPNTIFAATSNGVYRTRNAGTTWTQIATAVANMKDIEFRPGDTTTVYACSSTLFYKSTNAGTTFASTSTGLPATASVSRLSIAVTAANSAYVYVLAANTAYGYQGLYRSIDNGATFTTRSTTPNILGYSNTGATAGGQGWYDLALAVSPLNADQVVIGGINIWRSINGGTSWTLNAEWTGSGAPYVHADVHALEFLPGSGTTYFAGCDGGLFRTTTSGTSWSDLSNGLHISQAYRIGLSTTNANLLNTGWQDNGTARWNGTATWSRPLGGDGMECIIDWSNANVQYGELYYGEIRKTTTGGNYTTGIVNSGGAAGTVDEDGDWVTPYIEAPSNAATLFVGKSQIFKSTTSGGTWTQVGTISGGTGKVIALANAASNINYIYAAKIDRFYVSTTGTTFVDRTAGLPTASAAITYIAVHPTNPNRVWVTFSGYSSANKVWYSADAGVTWSNYSTGLPNLPVNCIVYQTNAVASDPLYVGTDVGVYYRDNASASWTAYNTGLPNVSVRELEIQYTALKLRAATFGRSIWQSDLNSPGTSPPTTDFIASRTNICVGDCISFTDLSAGSPTSWSWTFTGATVTTSSVQNPPSVCYNTAGTYAVTLVATNTNGSNTMTKAAYITVSSPIALPLVEGFQGATFVPANWVLSNPDLDATWAQTATAGGFATSTNSAVMDNLTPVTSIAGTIDDLLTPKYNFTGVATATMTFDVAYCRYNATYFDSLIVYVSTNCGSTWSRVYTKGGTVLATAPDNATTTFVPTSTQWRTETVSLTPYAGQANVMLKFQNKSGWGQMLYLDNINITSTGAPVASVAITQTTGTNPMCAGASATFTAVPTNGGTTPTYQWQVNGVNVGTNSPTYTTTTLTSGQIVTCIMTSSLTGVTGSPATSNAITMIVNAIPATPTVTNGGPYCVGATISLSTPAVTGATYSWTGPSAFTSALQNPTRPAATVAMAGTYSVTVTSSAGCTSLAGTTTVVVNALPATPTATNTGPYCAGATITLNTPAVTGASYAWTGPSAYTSALQNPTRPASTTAMAGTYSITVTVGGCTSLAGTTAVVVNAIPATPTAASNSPVCAGGTINLTTPTVSGATYAWTGPLSYTSAIQNATIAGATGAMAGTYSITVTTGGCTSLAGTTTVVVNALPATPTATNTGPYCAGATINLSTAAVAGATYSWTGPGAFTSALQNPTRPASTTAMAGTYSVTVTSAAGCTSLAGTTTVVVNAPPATPTATNTGPYCAGATITLATPTVTGATYSWTGPSAFTSALQNPTRPASTTAMAGTYSVTVTVGGCVSLAGTTTVAVSVIPATPTAGSSSPDCVGQTISLTANTVTGAAYSWTGPSSFSSTLEDPTRPSATAAMAGTYSVTVTVGGCTSLAGTTTVVINALPATPVPSINGSTTPAAICAGGTITLTTPTVGGATYSWTGPNSYTAAVRNPPALTSVTTAMGGTYSLTVTVGGCPSLAGTVSIVVNPIPATPTATNTGPYCTGATINLNTSAVTGATYSWTGPGAYSSAIQNATRPAATTAMSGTYSVTVTVSGCTSLAGTTAVVVSTSVTPANSIVASPSGAICAGTSVTFTATPSGGGTTPSYQWQVNGSNVGTNSPTYTSTTLTNGQNVTCILTSSSACASPTTATSNTITMVVNPSVTPSVSIAASPGTTICAGASVTFTATPTNGGTTPVYQWQLNGSNVGTGGTSYTSSSLTGGDVITCILTSNAACASPVTATSNALTITLTPPATPTITISIGAGTNPACAGQLIMFVASTTNGGSSPGYQWQINGANAGTSLATFSSSTLNNGDVVTCILTSNASCVSPLTVTSTGITMVVDAMPATPTISQSGNVLTSSAATGNQWYLNGILIVGATAQNYTFTTNGSYTVIVTNGACTSAESAPTVIINVGIADYTSLHLLTISPNPNDGNFNISFIAPAKETYTVELTNALGQLIFKEVLTDYSGTYNKQLSVVDYGKGVYTISLINSKNEIVKKIIVY